MNWLHYLLEANLYLCIFYAGYCLFLNKETHYTLNRVYLLLSCIISFVLPVVQIGWLKPAASATTVFILPNKGYQTTVHKFTTQPALTFNDLLLYAYIMGATVLAVILFIRLYQLARLTKATKTLIDDKYKLISIDGSNTAFSFFNYLFIGTKTHANHIIIRHELVHIRQKHSADIVFLELIKIINWFNPLIYLLQISLKTIHEYIADEQTAAQESDAISYSSFLVSNAYGLNGSSLAHSFFNYNLLKKRIIMLNQKRSGKLARLKYLVAVPISAGLLCASTLVFSKTYGLIDLMPRHTNTAPIQTATLKPAADTSQVNKTSTTTKGFKYEETGYLINNKTDFRVVITEKNGEHKEYYKSKATPEQLATLKTKYGYTFPKMLIYPKLPPPPPAPPAKGKTPKVVDVKFPPPAPPAAPKKSKKVIDVGLAPPPSVVEGAPPVSSSPPEPAPAEQKTPPPPPPPADPFEGLYKYIGKMTRYPTKAHDNHVTGRAIITFNISDGKINSVKVVRGIDPDIDNEIVRVLNQFNGDLTGRTGRYNIAVAFAIQDSKGNWIGNSSKSQVNQIKTKDQPTANKSAVNLNEVVVVSYI
jgi:hypothetical protein